jgi:predicted dithiol-disulfide oxidoreductase (DUF899 family)
MVARVAPQVPTRCPKAFSTICIHGNTTFAYVSRAPLDKIESYKRRKGWTFPWYSSYGSDFNYDFHITLDDSVAPVEYNFRTRAELQLASTPIDGEQPMEMPGAKQLSAEWEQPKGRAAEARGAIPNFAN